MNQPDKETSNICGKTFENLEQAWSEGRLHEVLQPSGQRRGDTHPAAGNVLHHLEECLSCRREAESLAQLDRHLETGFRELARSTPPPSEDQISRILRSVSTQPDVIVLKKIRRSLNTVLWITFFAFCLGACFALGALAYRILFLE